MPPETWVMSSSSAVVKVSLCTAEPSSAMSVITVPSHVGTKVVASLTPVVTTQECQVVSIESDMEGESDMEVSSVDESGTK